MQQFPSMTIGAIKTPDGKLYCTICEDAEGSPIRIETKFGKAGTSVASWAFAIDELVNMLLERGVGINEIIEKLSLITTGKPERTSEGIRVGSGPEGLAVALMEYKRQKYNELREKFDRSQIEE